MIPGNFRYIFFDADDTLWRNEEFFRAAEDRFAELLSSFAGKEHVKETLAEKQEENIPVFGYGSKTFLLSMRKRAMTTRMIASPLRKRRTDEDDATEAAMASTAATAARNTESASEPFRPE